MIQLREPLASVGMGCRCPGNASSPDAFWELLRDRRDAVVEIPADRWDWRRFYDPDRAAPGKMYVRHGAFLQDTDITTMDTEFFGMSPREAAPLDPQQRLLLEVTWEAFEDAVIDPGSLREYSVGVFVGGFTLDSRSYWIPGSWDLRIVYTDAIPFLAPSQESNHAGQHQESHR